MKTLKNIIKNPSLLMSSALWNGVERCNDAATSGTCAQNLNHISTLAGNITNIALGLVATISVLFLIYGSITYVTSAGNPDSLGRAKSTILYSILGLVLAILAYAIINFVVKIFP